MMEVDPPQVSLSVKTTGSLMLGEECGGNLFTGYMADGIMEV